MYSYLLTKNRKKKQKPAIRYTFHTPSEEKKRKKSVNTQTEKCHITLHSKQKAGQQVFVYVCYAL